MKDKLKKIFTNQFTWNVFYAFLSIVLTGCYIWEDKFFLATCWAIIAGSYIAMAWLHREE